MRQYRERGFRIVYLDEMMVTKSTMPTHEWSVRNEHVQISYNQFANQTIASIAAVS